MQKRRDFLKNVAGAAAGMRVGGRDLAGALQVDAPQGKRRELFIAGPSHKDGRRSRALLHAEVWGLVKDTPLAATAKGNLWLPERSYAPRFGWRFQAGCWDRWRHLNGAAAAF
jgi:hypothetical protein